MLPESVTVPVPHFVTPPEPLMAPEKVLLSVRSKASVPWLTTLPTRLPPSPICSVPALMVVPPV
ncbi:hypothetical protein D3C87_1310770 [compost metagenome]